MGNDYIDELIEHAEEAFGIEALHGDKINLFAQSWCGDNLLHAAVTLKCYSGVKYLAERGVDINAQGDLHMTPLFLAACGDDKKMVQLLLELGADNTIPDHVGNLPPNC